MQPFTFIHASDLHLDAVLPSPSGEDSPFLRELLSAAVPKALQRLVDLCISEQAAFLILAGDVFHEGSGSLKANFDLSDAFEKLKEHGIEVFWARGNHDSFNQSDNAMRWPDNVRIFSADGESFMAGGASALAEVQGVSHKSRHERANLVPKISGTGEGFTIGVLHCAVNGLQGQHASYAPCTLGDLAGTGKDYWALGHVHGPALLSTNPLVVYSGSLQGLHVNEPGEHGCYVVSVNSRGQAEPRFAALAPVRWEKFQLDIAQVDSQDALLDFAQEQINDFCTALAADSCPLELLLLRLEITGRSPLDALLRKGGSLTDLAARLNKSFAVKGGGFDFAVRIKDINLSTSPDVDIAALAKNENLVGETLRCAQLAESGFKNLASAGLTNFSDLERALAGQPWAADVLAGLAELYGDRRLEETQAMPSAEELAEMAREAAALCLHLFEVES